MGSGNQEWGLSTKCTLFTIELKKVPEAIITNNNLSCQLQPLKSSSPFWCHRSWAGSFSLQHAGINFKCLQTFIIEWQQLRNHSYSCQRWSLRKIMRQFYVESTPFYKIQSPCTAFFFLLKMQEFPIKTLQHVIFPPKPIPNWLKKKKQRCERRSWAE